MLSSTTWAYTQQDADNAVLWNNVAGKLRPKAADESTAESSSGGSSEGSSVQHEHDDVGACDDIPQLIAIPQYYLPDGLMDSLGSKSRDATLPAFVHSASLEEGDWGQVLSRAAELALAAEAAASASECEAARHSPEAPEQLPRGAGYAKNSVSAQTTTAAAAWDTHVSTPPGLSKANWEENLEPEEYVWGNRDSEVTTSSQWHSSALSAGTISEDGHVFTKAQAGPVKNHSNGMTLSSLCMLFERSLRFGGTHWYSYTICEGIVGAADGVGFVFDSRIRRTNIQRMRSIFLNRHGQVCIRNMDVITKLQCSLPKLSEGTTVYFMVDLDNSYAAFRMVDEYGSCLGSADFSFAGLITPVGASPTEQPREQRGALRAQTGFFCAIVTGRITVALH